MNIDDEYDDIQDELDEIKTNMLEDVHLDFKRGHHNTANDDLSSEDPPSEEQPFISPQRGTLIGATLLIIVGLFLLAQQLGWLGGLNIPIRSLVLGGISLFFLAVYAASGFGAWGLLFPVTIPLAIALQGVLDLVGDQDSALIIGSVAIPFWAAFLTYRLREWWPLIPGGILASVATGQFVGSLGGPEFLSSGIIMLGIGLSFALVYLVSRSQWWALIPASIVGLGSLIPFMQAYNLEFELPLAAILGVAGLGFVVAAVSGPRWWPIIPAGIMFTIAIGLLLEVFLGITGRYGTAFGFLGVSLTFGVVWLLQGRYETRWAVWPMLICFAIASVVAIATPTTLPILIPVLLILGGGVLLLRGLQR